MQPAIATRRRCAGLLGALALTGTATQAQTVAASAEGQRVEVTGHYINSIGGGDAASAGTITPQLIEDRPLLRPGDLLEYIPGMVVTQHSGDGKANQISCAASTSTTAPISRPGGGHAGEPAAPMRMARATPT